MSVVELERLVPGLQVVSSIGQKQASGFLHSLPFFFLCSAEEAKLELGQQGGDEYYGEESLYSASAPRCETFIDQFTSLVLSLTRTPFTYSFEIAETVRVKNGYARTGFLSEAKVRAHSAEEARSVLLSLRPPAPPEDPSRPALSRTFATYWASADPSILPLREDTRTFPDPEPVFTVRGTSRPF